MFSLPFTSAFTLGVSFNSNTHIVTPCSEKPPSVGALGGALGGAVAASCTRMRRKKKLFATFQCVSAILKWRDDENGEGKKTKNFKCVP